MEIGRELNLLIKDHNDHRMVMYRCTVIGMDNQFVYIDYPINKETQRTSIFPNGTILLVTYIDKANNLYQFSTTIRKRVTLTIPGLAIDVPKKEDLKQIQRREYVRLKTAIDIAVHPTDHTFKPFTTVTNDISAGGVSIVIPPLVELNKKQILSLWLALHMKSGIKYIHIQGRLIHMNHLKNGTKTASIKFIATSEQMRQSIIQFVFEKQRNIRKKELM